MTVRGCSIGPLNHFRFFIEGDKSPLMRTPMVGITFATY